MATSWGTHGFLGARRKINSTVALCRSANVLEVTRLDTALAGRASAQAEYEGGAGPQKQEAQESCCRL